MAITAVSILQAEMLLCRTRGDKIECKKFISTAQTNIFGTRAQPDIPRTRAISVKNTRSISGIFIVFAIITKAPEWRRFYTEMDNAAN